jgi:lysophospholipase L1-like esterase
MLFQGDSITDAGRGGTPDGMGRGYAALAAMTMQALFPEKRLEFLNRGVSGNRAKDLLARWDRDCIELAPGVVSIMIGINDCWRRFDSNDPTPAEAFERDYRRVLERTRDELGAKIVMIEPFLLPHPEDREAWRADLDPKIAAARRLAREFADVYVPMDGVFASKLTVSPPSYWAADGVHPTPAGHGLIALEWVAAVSGGPPRSAPVRAR